MEVTFLWNLRNINENITIEIDGGINNESNPEFYTISTSTIKLANPTKAGYSFKGWYSDSKFKTKVTEIKKGSTGKKTLYAKWSIKTYNISYQLNGGKNASGNPAGCPVAGADGGKPSVHHPDGQRTRSNLHRDNRCG